MEFLYEFQVSVGVFTYAFHGGKQRLAAAEVKLSCNVNVESLFFGSEFTCVSMLYVHGGWARS